MKSVEIQTVIYICGNRYRNPERAASKLARLTASNLCGDGWHIEYDESLSEPEQQAKFDKDWDEYEIKCDRIEARAYPRYLKVCKRILA
jgi:hypothetical protein